jgi:hypothetical protein
MSFLGILWDLKDEIRPILDNFHPNSDTFYKIGSLKVLNFFTENVHRSYLPKPELREFLSLVI